MRRCFSYRGFSLLNGNVSKSGGVGNISVTKAGYLARQRTLTAQKHFIFFSLSNSLSLPFFYPVLAYQPNWAVLLSRN